ncbi:MAG: hypothetical protein ABEK00_00560 [Candidatus Nanohaloarchaea archaeon]
MEEEIQTRLEDSKIGVLDYLWDTLDEDEYKTLSEITSEIDISRNSVHGMSEHGLLHEERDKGFKLSQDGIRALQLHKNTASNNRLADLLVQNRRINATLINHQRRSSAVETLFMIALLTFSFYQVLNTLQKIDLPVKTRLGGLILVSILYLVIMSAAGLLGGGNLLNEIKSSLTSQD